MLGNESHGLTPALASRLDAHLTIPMPGRAESLNVAMTFSILCFEAARQRRTEDYRPRPRSGGVRRRYEHGLGWNFWSMLSSP